MTTNFFKRTVVTCNLNYVVDFIHTESEISDTNNFF